MFEKPNPEETNKEAMEPATRLDELVLDEDQAKLKQDIKFIGINTREKLKQAIETAFQ